MKTPLPPDFQVRDCDRTWAIEKGYPLYICDAFLSDFKDYFLSPNATRARKANWHAALRTWVRSASPAGDKYNAGTWGRRYAQAKDMERQQAKRLTKEFYTKSPAGYAQKESRPTPMPAATRAILERMRR